MKLSKTLLRKIGQSGGFLGRLLGPLLKTALPLMGNKHKSLVKSVLMLLGLKTAASAKMQLFRRKCSDLILQINNF